MGRYQASNSKMVKKKEVQVSDKDLEEYREAFELFDTDKSGMIDAMELGFCMRALGFDPTPEEIKGMLDKTDQDGNGTVEFTEFVDLLSGRMDRRDPEEEMKDGFAMFDTDGKGFITWKDLQRVATELNDKDIAENEPELQQIIDEINPQGINLNDFLSLMGRQGVY